MKTGKSIVELANEIQRRADAKHDYIAPVDALHMVVGQDNVPQLRLDTRGPMPLTSIAHSQVSEYTGIPKAYYDRLKNEAPGLLADNVNKWLPKVKKDNKIDRRMVRALDGEVRAFLSDTYRSLENEDLAEAILPVFLDPANDLVIASAEITERRLYIKAYSRNIERDVPSGAKRGDGSHVIYDTISPAVIVSNSEVGYGRLSVEHGVYTKGCTNLGSWGAAFKRTHIGSRAEDSDEIYSLLTDQTKRLADAAIWAKVRDVVKGALASANFEAKILQLGLAADRKLPLVGATGVVEVVERVGRKFNLDGTERQSVLQHLIEGGDLTQYGLYSAITRSGQDAVSYDRASELERVGGQIIELAANDWSAIAEAA